MGSLLDKIKITGNTMMCVRTACRQFSQVKLGPQAAQTSAWKLESALRLMLPGSDTREVLGILGIICKQIVRPAASCLAMALLGRPEVPEVHIIA